MYLHQLIIQTIFNSNFEFFDYFQEFKKGKQIHLKFLAQFKNEIIHSQHDLKLKQINPILALLILQSKQSKL
ncbi:unnamed protein product [Paramecium sonneborni]|uniref:Uncharacterized protein n=1 Tax=Paramecium sonneborni TaxID=65129 RepID=A0A8S1QA94_9CILI|nr:unnamed protein product [Paramecium sonneborni]